MLSRCLSDGVRFGVWVVGKYDLRVREHMPYGGTAVVFAVPCPLTPGEGGADSALTGSRFRNMTRADLRVIDGGLMRVGLGPAQGCDRLVHRWILA